MPLLSRLAISLLTAASLFPPQAAIAETLLGRIVSITDGDTVTVLDPTNQQHKIRLMGIDAPEKAQPFGSRSQQNLGALLFGRDVAVEWNKRDRYGRIVGKIMVAAQGCNDPQCPKDVDSGLEQIKIGLAWWYQQYAREQTPTDRASYEQAEFMAKTQRLGLWADRNSIPPWQWRREK
ncbi:MAG: nuclease [Rhodocyclaceae bacterium]|nr:nuclease [Rhodocyclaceae bacterium]